MKYLIMTVLFLVAACGHVNPYGVDAGNPAAFMPAGTSIAAPRQYVFLCYERPEMCRLPAGEATRMLQELHRITRAKFTVKDDGLIDTWGRGLEGDCDDFAYAMKEGATNLFSSFNAAFGVATAWTEHDQYHMVMTAETTDGTIVCDIRQTQCHPWGALPYKWDQRQIGVKWTKIGEGK